jgi:hypothetical protein
MVVFLVVGCCGVLQALPHPGACQLLDRSRGKAGMAALMQRKPASAHCAL